MKNLLLGVRFGTELALLAGAFWAAWDVSVVLGVVAVVAVAVVWGLWVAPKATRRLSDPPRLGLEVALFGMVGVALAASGRPVAGVLLVVAGVAIAVAVRRVVPDS